MSGNTCLSKGYPQSETPGSRSAVHVLMGEKRKKWLDRRNLTESTIVRRSIGLPVLFESCRGSAHTRPMPAAPSSLPPLYEIC
ncbi:hypothetical protein TNCV_2697001 [Trichonephila clavipes]|nr:hypothetical protein TNCV_2697001 [Trichonephila clavipes]